MSKALENAIKNDAWVSPTSYGADRTGIVPADAAFALARAKGKPIKVPAGTFLLLSPITVSLLIGQDFVMTGEGPEVSRLVFGPDATHGINVSYSTNGSGQSQGDKTAVRISGLDIETQKAGGGSAIRIINTPPAGQVNETQVSVDINSIRTNGTSNAAYWDIHTELENVTFPSLRDIEAQDSANRGVALSLNSNGSYAAVEFAIDNYRANQVDTGLKVRGRCEGVYASHFVAVGGRLGIDWQATVVAGGKKPLLSLTGSHINVSETGVKALDVAQVIAADTLVYVTNSAAASAGFDFSATGSLSSETHQLAGITIIGIGSRVGSNSVGVRLGANVIGCTIDAKIDNLNLGVENTGVRNLVASSSTISNCNTRTTGFSSVGYYGEAGNTVSVDGSLQMEYSAGDGYSRDQSREQLRALSFIFTAAGGTESVIHTLSHPFRVDTAMLFACWGEVPNAGAVVIPVLAGSTKDDLHFTVIGATAGAPFRINFIAYGY